MRNKFIILYCWFVRTLLFFFPDIPIFMRFRGWLYGLFMIRCGKDFQVTHDVVIKELNHIAIGKHCFIGNGSVVMGSGLIEIGDDVMIAPNVVVVSGNHTSVSQSYRRGKIDAGRVSIGNGSWVASNCTVAKGAVLPEDSVLAANSFLNKHYDVPHAIYGGSPARLIKERFLDSDK